MNFDGPPDQVMKQLAPPLAEEQGQEGEYRGWQASPSPSSENRATLVLMIFQ